MLRVVNPLAADIAALDDAGSVFLHHFPNQADLHQRLPQLDPAPSRFRYHPPPASPRPRRSAQPA